MLLGATGVHRIGAPPPPPEVSEVNDEVGYWLAAGARGRGVATRAVRLLTEWAGRELGVPTLWLQVMEGNERSVAVAERSGYRYHDARPVIERGAPVTMLRFRHDR
jgi:RimJ/RimL family protein N-acetyltransferase